MYYTKKFKSAEDRKPPEFDARGILRKLNYFPFINLNPCSCARISDITH